MQSVDKKLTERIENWKKSLLDMSKRNRMLWYKPYRVGSLELDIDTINPKYPDLYSALEKLLAGESWTFASQPPEYDEDEEEWEDEEELDEDFLRTIAEEKARIAAEKTHITKIKNQIKSLRSIMRRDKQENDEKGLNVNYIAVGFLEWYEVENSNIKIESPLIMIPVKITQVSRLEPFEVTLNTDEDIVINPVIRKKLLEDFDFELDLVMDEKTGHPDIPASISELRSLATTQPRWNITDRMVIDTFQFHNLAIWNDLDKNSKLVTSSPFGQILAGAELTDVGLTYHEDDIDLDSIKSKENVCILEADSSQMEAIRRAHDGESFVIQGPPGTGKSQTITNIIADQLYQGKKILFVSEKQAALDVVYHKLEQNGLADFCLIMHNANQKKANVREQLQKSVLLATGRRRRIAEETMSTYSQLDNEVKKLNLYVNDLHTKCANGTTIHQIFGEVAALEKYPDLVFQMPESFDWNLDYDLIKNIFDAITSYGEAFLDDSKHFTNNYWRYYTGEIDSSTGRKVKEIIADFNSAKLHNELNNLHGEISSNAELDNLLARIEMVRDNFTKLPFQQAEVTLIDQEITDAKSSSTNIHNQQAELTKQQKDFAAKKAEAQKEIKTCDAKIKSLTTEITTKFSDDFLSLAKTEDLHKKLVNKYPHFYQHGASEYKEIIRKLNHYTTAKLKYRDYVEYLAKKNELDQEKNNKAKYEKNLHTLENKNETQTQNLNTKIDELKNNYARELEVITQKTEQQLQTIDDLLENLDFDKLPEFQHFWQARQKVINEYGQIDFVNQIDNSEQVFLAKDIGKIFQKRFYRLYLEQTKFMKDYHTYLRVEHDKDVDAFREYDAKTRNIARERIRCELMSRLPDISGFSNQQRGGEITILRHELQKKTRLMPTRKLFEKLPVIIPQLKPCLMMSPLTVSSYFGTNANWKFDIVIFDEASQVRSEYAVPSIVRGKQIIIAGDAKQMPPTRFFDASFDEDSDYDEEADDTKDLESILDEMSAKLPDKCLNWHYRSRDESLIAFSNHKFYNNRLHTFPSAAKNSKNLGVNYIYCEDGVWESRNGNRPEAELVAKLVFEHAKTQPTKSLGVVAFGSSQETAILEAVDKVREMHPELEEFFSENHAEPFFIKNLENVQGDERDRIILSCGYGKDTDGKFAMRFGPLAMAGGERRLNVAISRAKEQMTVVSSFKATEIREADENHRARKLIRDFIDYAERGEIALLGEDEINKEDKYMPEFDSDFERDVYDFLKSKGYKMRTQVGASGYRIDIGVFHPEIDGRYVLAIECDGASYHNSVSARDRDILRQEILENLGWNFYRIWSVDWIYNNTEEKQRLVEAIEDAIRNYNCPRKKSSESNEQTKTSSDDSYELLKLRQLDRIGDPYTDSNDDNLKYEQSSFKLECIEIKKKLLKSYRTPVVSNTFDNIIVLRRSNCPKKITTLDDILAQLVVYRNGYSTDEFFREIHTSVFGKSRLSATARAKYQLAFDELVKQKKVELVNGITIRVL